MLLIGRFSLVHDGFGGEEVGPLYFSAALSPDDCVLDFVFSETTRAGSRRADRFSFLMPIEMPGFSAAEIFSLGLRLERLAPGAP